MRRDGESVTSALTERPVPEPEAPRTVADLDASRGRRRTLLWIGGLTLLLAGTLPVAVGLGPVAIAPGTVAQIIGHHLFGWPQAGAWSESDDSIVWLVRM